MDTLAFFRLLLPDAGTYYLALFREGQKVPQHKAYTDLTQMAKAVESYSKNPDLSVYHACGSYLEASITVEENGVSKTKWRVPDNWARAKAFWVDIDCGAAKAEKGDGYATQKEAAKAIFTFADTIGWPRPMLVSSGYGLHAYWPLVKSIKAEAWVRVASLLKATLKHEGVLADPTRTSDFASILRPVGAVNRKYDSERTVRALTTCEPLDPKALAEALAQYVKDNSVKLAKTSEPSAPRAAAPLVDLNSDLTAHVAQFPDLPSNPDLVADGCAQVAAMRDTQGDVTYEHWRRVIGILKHCEGGEAKAKEWSAQREATGHDQNDWQHKFDTWTTGPSLCAQLEEISPGGCNNCPHFGKIKTPLVLGRTAPAAEDFTTTAVDDTGAEIEVEVPALPESYAYSNGLLCRVLLDKDDVPKAFPFSTVLFYPTARIRGEDGTYRIGMRMHLPNKKVRDFEMAFEAMASGTDMLRSLAKYELMQSNHKDAGTHMAAYLRDQLEALKRRVDETNTLTSFGWAKDHGSFLLGDRLYLSDGTVRRVLVGGGAAKYAKELPTPKGTITGYASAMNFIYNRPGMQHFQYAICAGWGSLLTPFGEELYKGLLLALRGGDSGKGKTTACWASLYAFGNANGMSLKSEEGFTVNGLWGSLAAFNNVPMLIDELTHMEPIEFSKLAYGVSRGEEKVRMQSRGGSVSFAPTMTWGLSPLITGNKDFHGLLASMQANSQAEAVRLVQVDADRYPRVELIQTDKPRADMDASELAEVQSKEAALVHSALMEMKSNAGVAGEAMVRYAVTHVKELTDELRDVRAMLAQHLPDSHYRYYVHHGACTLVIARVAKDLGIVDFDLEALTKFTVHLLVELANTVAVTNTVSPAEAFGRMMAQLQSRILITVEFRDKRHKDGPETPRSKVFGDIAGRYVLGSPNKKDHAGEIMLNQKDVREWCMRNRVDFNTMLDALDAEGALVSRQEKITLTRGTDVPTVQARCIVVNALKLDKDALSLVPPVAYEDLPVSAAGV
jgi:hypothetical protein